MCPSGGVPWAGGHLVQIGRRPGPCGSRSRTAATRPMPSKTALFPSRRSCQTVKPLVQRSTLPVGMAVLGIVVIVTGWLLLEGVPFVLGCAITCAAAAAAIALATSHLRDR